MPALKARKVQIFLSFRRLRWKLNSLHYCGNVSGWRNSFSDCPARLLLPVDEVRGEGMPQAGHPNFRVLTDFRIRPPRYFLAGTRRNWYPDKHGNRALQHLHGPTDTLRRFVRKTLVFIPQLLINGKVPPSKHIEGMGAIYVPMYGVLMAFQDYRAVFLK